MKQILVLGAGQSAPYLIHHLLQDAEAHDWFVTVGDIDAGLAERRIGDHPRGSGIRVDVHDSAMRSTEIEKADLVINMLSSSFQDLLGWDCVRHKTPMITVSYRTREARNLTADARRQGILMLYEMGLDPGIDHMSAMQLIRRLQDDGGRVTEFCSYGSGIPAPDQEQNPLRYMITWNPRNVVMSGEHGAQYMEEGRVKIVPFHELFHHTWAVNVDGVGQLEAYPNRDSLSYMEAFDIRDVRTMIRGTLRYPGFSETWAQIVRLGLPNERLRIPDLQKRTYREVVEMFLPLNVTGPRIETRLARFLGISPTGRIMDDFRQLGLLSDEPVQCQGETAAAMMIDLLNRKLPMTPGMRDLVVLVHQIDVEYPDRERPPERVVSTLVEYGEPGGFTAMAKTVGLPVAVAARLLLTGEFPLTGCHIPIHPAIYEPVLREMNAAGLTFRETVTPTA
jgi:saccharopine dehydrogenase (NADP+, L-glutamate forming)